MLKRREQAICECCGQRLLVRHGVKLSPILADMFDMIDRCGDVGISGAVMAGIFYPDRSYNDGRQCVRVNISHLNSRLASTDVEVRAAAIGPRRSPYRIIKRQNP